MTPATTRPTTTPTTVPASGACAATHRIVGMSTGGFRAEVTVQAGNTAINGWTAQFALGSGQTIGQLWKGTPTISGTTVTVKNVSCNGAPAANASSTFGFLATGSARPFGHHLRPAARLGLLANTW